MRSRRRVPSSRCTNSSKHHRVQYRSIDFGWLVGGLVYGGMRLYRRRFGSLDAEEAMTTLHLTGE